MKTKSLLAIVLCAVFGSLAFCEPKSEPMLTKSRDLVGQTAPGAILGIRVPKGHQAKFDSAKPRMQEFLANMACYKANKNDKFMEGGTRAPALRRDDSHFKRTSGTCSDSVDIFSIENVKFIDKNAFSFSVTFITADGEETTKFDDIIFTQHPSGEWLVRWQ
ncbi:hypothetical protein [Campylobacter concisus]|uniref:hypothetical protein n=1 Tax=Campylobacter concisus TaxID=199 RepID=UPI000CD88EBF|nr:hypothetical protein [Campylobacter concisus]